MNAAAIDSRPPSPDGNPPAFPEVHRRISASLRVKSANDGTEFTFQALGSPCRICLTAPRPVLARAPEAVLRWIAGFEATYSRFIPTSLVCRINDAAGRDGVAVDPATDQILALCHEMHFLSRGTFDPTALPLIQLWDWKSAAPTVPTDAAIAAARAKVGWRRVQRTPGKVFLPEAGMALDLGGMGKEYAVDQLLQLLIELGASSGLVDLGADVRVFGPPPQGKPAWHIGLEDPAQPGRCWTGLAVRDQAVATSGDYRRHFVADGRRYGHILDVRTGRPMENGCRAVSVIAPSCSLAGMLATAAFVLGPQDGLRLIEATPQAEGCIVGENVTLPTRGFHALATR